ncbi:MAG: hypothetical protein HZA16_12315 [Nitrospirae bacterium]|nr:hypothetical protein [Nitrospirota bacterium]
MQLVKSSPKTPQYCRVVFVTGDELLSTDLSGKVQAVSNVKLYKDIEDVKSLINTLTSQVKEELIEKIKDKVFRYFFEKDDNDCLYTKEKIYKKIEERYADKLAELPPNGDNRKNGTRYISAPRFFSKKGQRITWKTRIDVVSKAFKKIKPSPTIGLGLAELYAMQPKSESSEGLKGIAG